MQLFIRVKQLGKRKDIIQEKPFCIETPPLTVKDLITVIVKKQVDEFNQSPDENTFLSYLTSQQISEQSEVGKIGFGVHYNEKKADETEAIQNALQSFEDGIYRLFLNDKELSQLSEAIQLQENDHLTFIRLTMLAGRMW